MSRIDLVKLTKELVEKSSPYEEELALARKEIHRLERKTKQIAVVEDNEASRIFITEILRTADNQIIEFKNGQEIIDFYKKNHHSLDLIYMDIMMPIVDGVTATIEIRKFEKEKGLEPIQIIALTAYPEKKEEYLAVGMNGVLAKMDVM